VGEDRHHGFRDKTSEEWFFQYCFDTSSLGSGTKSWRCGISEKYGWNLKACVLQIAQDVKTMLLAVEFMRVDLRYGFSF
jgi:hypothetical protein